MLVDDWLGVVRSTNLDPLSLNKLGEGSMVVSDPKLAGQLEQDFLQDCERAKEMHLPKDGRSGLYKRFSRRLTVWAGMDR
jgi:cardiolipin synthase